MLFGIGKRPSSEQEQDAEQNEEKADAEVFEIFKHGIGWMGNMVMCPMLGLGGSFNLVGAALSDSPKSRVMGKLAHLTHRLCWLRLAESKRHVNNECSHLEWLGFRTAFSGLEAV